MAQFLYLRQRSGLSIPEGWADQVLLVLTPDGILPTYTHQAADGQAALVVTDGEPYVATDGLSMVMGHCRRLPEKWARYPARSLDVPFRLMHDSTATVLETDTVGARSCWYYHDSEVFIASSSQRALVACLGEFRLNEQVLPWWLANGNLGPGLGWDRRIQRLEPATVLKLHDSAWELVHERLPLTWPERREPITAVQLRTCIEDSFSSFVLPGPGYVLTLSGGYDSRVVLYQLRRLGLQIPTLTWGLSHTRNNPGSDAYLAAQLARHFQVPNEFVPLDSPRHPDWEEILTAFVRVGDGRLDHLYHAVDGFAMFRQLRATGVRGFVRADEVFGWLPAQTEKDARVVIDAALPEDYDNLKRADITKLWGQPEWPELLRRQPSETVPMWRDRLYINYRQPYVMSALHTMHLGFLEECNPLVSTLIVSKVLQMTDSQRTLKKLYRQAVDPWVSMLPIASVTSHPQTANLLSTRTAVDFLEHKIRARGSELFPEPVVALALHDLRCDEHRVTSVRLKPWEQLYRFIPPAVKKAIRNRITGYSTQPNLLALRIALALIIKDEMHAAAKHFSRNAAYRINS